ncbi:hypothetical protein NQT62_13355 [Limnobacter humi]|uniref:Uncharacterized protein n=1 Tax=Limnobacter humi TaxID=1778671 RepID=A0ABT1WIR8_9BURK|nr:hypothetical protein [Limnobacter humi]MCQ8897423.1 hypothetical protein [Limnobacter humi]
MPLAAQTSLFPSTRTHREVNSALYSEAINPASNPRLNQQFVALAQVLSSAKGLDGELQQLLESMSANPAKPLLVCIDRACWPAAYQPAERKLVIHPDLIRIAQDSPPARLYAAAEIFDQVIYATLHAQSTDSSASMVFQGVGTDVLKTLVRIKEKKQTQQQTGLSNAQSDQPSEANAPLLIDPTSAWHLACPRYGDESHCVRAFVKAANKLLASRP